MNTVQLLDKKLRDMKSRGMAKMSFSFDLENKDGYAESMIDCLMAIDSAKPMIER